MKIYDTFPYNNTALKSDVSDIIQKAEGSMKLKFTFSLTLETLTQLNILGSPISKKSCIALSMLSQNILQRTEHAHRSSEHSLIRQWFSDLWIGRRLVKRQRIAKIVFIKKIWKLKCFLIYYVYVYLQVYTFYNVKWAEVHKMSEIFGAKL